MAHNINKKTYSLIIRAKKSFSVFISNFPFSETLLFRVRDKIRLVITSQVYTGLFSMVNARKIRIIFSQMKLISNLLITINAKKVRLSIIMRQIGKIVSPIYIRVEQVFNISSRQKAITLIDNIFSISTDPILASFFILSTYDGESLSTMDSETLSDLDYSTT